MVRTLDHTRYYTGSSNQVNLRNSGPYQFQPPETYYRINRGFSVELGIPSVPTLESLESFHPRTRPLAHQRHLGVSRLAPERQGRWRLFSMDAMETEFGAPTSLEDFERKAQMLDYVGHRAIFEGFAAHLWQPNSGRMIWMTQPAWPSMEWNFLSWDYDTQSSFYGTQEGLRAGSRAVQSRRQSVDLINLGEARPYNVRTRVISLDGKVLSDQTNQVEAAADARTPVDKTRSRQARRRPHRLRRARRHRCRRRASEQQLLLVGAKEATLRELDTLPTATGQGIGCGANAANGERKATVKLKNSAAVPALLVKLTLQDAATGRRILPAYYSENYVSLLPGEQRTITVEFAAGTEPLAFSLRGWNLEAQVIMVRPSPPDRRP